MSSMSAMAGIVVGLTFLSVSAMCWRALRGSVSGVAARPLGRARGGPCRSATPWFAYLAFLRS